MVEKFSKNLIPVAIIIAGVCITGAVIYINQGKVGILSSQEAAQIAIDFINQNMLQEGMEASLINVIEENGLYKFHFKIGEQEFDSYVTKNGKFLFIEGINLDPGSVDEKEEEASQEIPKRDAPDVKLFVMSYCPFGLQAQKMFLPVYDLLKDKAKIEVYFVNYIMHEKKEIDENLRQYCIQKEQKEKYAIYLGCFVKDGDFEKCLSEVDIDKAKLATCISETDTKYNITTQYNDKSTWLNGRFPKFDIHTDLTDLNEKYEVGGSPTTVINDKVVNISPRSPEKFKETICQAFTSQPQECSQSLSNNVPSSGFGGGTSSSSEGGCQ